MLNQHTPILLTGATGLIGGELLRTLLKAGQGHVTAIVRPNKGGDVESRIIQRMRRSGCMEGSALDELQVVPGDLRMPGLGLSPADSARIRAEAEIIVHAAAETSFVRDRNCHETNVLGVRHLIDFAGGCPRRPLVVYVSTATNCGIVTHRCIKEEEGCQPHAQHHNDYTLSKAVAEQMLWDSGLNLLVLRPSIVLSTGLSDSVFARMILWFVPLLAEFAAVPVDPASRLDVVPVSFVVDVALALLRLPERRSNCYHLSAGLEGAKTCGDWSGLLDGFYERRQSLLLVPPAQWSRELHRRHVGTPERRKMFSQLKHYLPFLNMDVVFDNTRLRAELGPEAVRIPSPHSYLSELLALVPYEAAVQESLNP